MTEASWLTTCAKASSTSRSSCSTGGRGGAAPCSRSRTSPETLTAGTNKRRLGEQRAGQIERRLDIAAQADHADLSTGGTGRQLAVDHRDFRDRTVGGRPQAAAMSVEHGDRQDQAISDIGQRRRIGRLAERRAGRAERPDQRAVANGALQLPASRAGLLHMQQRPSRLGQSPIRRVVPGDAAFDRAQAAGVQARHRMRPPQPASGRRVETEFESDLRRRRKGLRRIRPGDGGHLVHDGLAGSISRGSMNRSSRPPP